MMTKMAITSSGRRRCEIDFRQLDRLLVLCEIICYKEYRMSDDNGTDDDEDEEDDGEDYYDGSASSSGSFSGR